MGKYFELEQRIPSEPIQSIEVARAYDASIRISTRIPMERVIARVSPFCNGGTQILDLGCTTGLLSLMLGGRYPNIKIYGIEEDRLLLQVAEENEVLAVMANSPAKVEFHYGVLSDLSDVESESVDIIVSYSSLHRWSDPVKTLQACSRICKPEGIVVICDLARDAEEGVIQFILQYISSEQDQIGFMNTLKASYTVHEIERLFKEANLSHWKVFREGVDLWIISKSLQAS